MPTLNGGTARLLGDADASVLVFFRPNQERSLAALSELARCQAGFAGKRVHWVGIVSDSVAVESVATLMRETRLVAPVLVDRGDTLYGSLGIALHPVVVLVDREHKLAAFEPYRSVDYCAVVGARVRHALREISDDEMRRVLEPPKTSEGSDEQVARRYRALAEMQLKSGNLDKALESARRSIDRNPLLAPAHVLLGEILFAQGNCPGAAEAFSKAVAIDPTSASARAGVERCTPAR